MAGRNSAISLTCTALLLVIIVGALIGHVASIISIKHLRIIQHAEKLARDGYRDTNITDTMLAMVDTERMRNNLIELSKEPHLAGTKRDDDLAKMIKKQWLEAGLDDVQLVPYTLLLSYPNPDNPNKVILLDDTQQVKYMSAHQEEVVRPEDEHPDFIHSFSAYSPAAQVTGDLVYVNYGRVRDFEKLEKLGVRVEGNICIARYGRIFRGNKVDNCHTAKGIGIIIFSDPKDVAVDGTDPKDVYPNSWWLPGTGMQRGSVLLKTGDPSTPNYPSLDNVYRIPEDKAELPKIPAQPIGYKDAKEFLKLMTGPPAPKYWSGGFKDVEYNLGPGFITNSSNWKVQLTVNNILKKTRNYNVIGRINGEIEPDRYVLLGNHRDAWGYGAVDPSAGTAQMLETARVFGKMVANGWRPRRTLVFCSWGAEEYGLTGSTEWVEDKLPALMSRAVAYVNNDICVSGPELRIRGSALLDKIMRKAVKMVESPLEGFKNLYEMWKDHYHRLKKMKKKKKKKKNSMNQEPGEPVIRKPGSGSDFAPFYFYAGVSVIDISFKRDKTKYKISKYPAYHTGYETFYMVDKLIDPGFKFHKSCSQLSIATLHLLADSLLLPFDMETYASNIIKAIQKIKSKKNYEITSTGLLPLYNELHKEAEGFKKAADDWVKRRDEVDSYDFLKVRAFNDQAIGLERVFILPDGLPGRPDMRHGMFAPSKYSSYSNSGLPGVSDLLHQWNRLSSSEKAEKTYQLNIHISQLIAILHQATQLLQPYNQL